MNNLSTRSFILPENKEYKKVLLFTIPICYFVMDAKAKNGFCERKRADFQIKVKAFERENVLLFIQSYLVVLCGHLSVFAGFLLLGIDLMGVEYV